MNKGTQAEFLRQLIEQEQSMHRQRMSMYTQALERLRPEGSASTAPEGVVASDDASQPVETPRATTSVPSLPTQSEWLYPPQIASTSEAARSNPYAQQTTGVGSGASAAGASAGPAGPIGAGASAAAPAAPLPAPAPRKARDREAQITRAVAIGGAVITFIGVALLVAIAIQNGWLGPAGRVVLAFAVSAGLGGVAYRVRATAPPVAFLALAATSLYTALVTVFVVVHVLEWWPVIVGSVGIGLLYAGATVAALRYHDGRLNGCFAVGSMVAVMAHLLAAAWDQNLAAAVGLVVPAAAFVIAGQVRPQLWLRNVAGLVLAVGLGFAFANSAGADGAAGTVGAVDAEWILAVLAAGAMVGLSIAPGWNPGRWYGASPSAAARQAWHIGKVPDAAASVAAPVVLAWTLSTSAWEFAQVLAVLAAAVVAGVSLMARFERAPVRLMGQVLVGGTLLFLYFNAAQSWLSLTAFALFFAAWVLLIPVMRTAVAWVVWVLAALWITADLAGFITYTGVPMLSQARYLGPQGCVVLVFLILVATVLLRGRGHLRGLPTPVLFLVGLCALYLSSTAVVVPLASLGASIGGMSLMVLGFVSGHALVSISWMGLGAYLLLSRGLLENRAAMITGLVLAAASVAKLIFFDLSALGGFPRAFAFLICGLVLLAVALRRGSLRAGKGEKVPPGHL
ncbi:hypothetical protein ACTXMG_11130 [Corynebacterium flavescens]|uniref:hypothetical protein n=1 Tax=Corynebacterium flavescens TaxID=28028 RepID=UPI003FD21AC9